MEHPGPECGGKLPAAAQARAPVYVGANRLKAPENTVTLETLSPPYVAFWPPASPATSLLTAFARTSPYRRAVAARTRIPNMKRITISAASLDQYLTEQLRRTSGFEDISLAAGYRLRTTDADGCNWSGDVVPLRGIRGPSSEVIAEALRPIVKTARARFNLSE